MPSWPCLGFTCTRVPCCNHLLCSSASNHAFCAQTPAHLTYVLRLQSANYVYHHFQQLAPSNGAAPSVGLYTNLPVSDGSFTNLAKAQPREGVAVPGPAPAFPSIALASEVNGTSVPSTAAAAPATVGAIYGTPGPSNAPSVARAGAPAPQG